MPDIACSEVTRLESLWQGTFGDEYVERNKTARNGREPFWRHFLEAFTIRSVLEVGCNVGANLFWLGRMLEPHAVHGVDINKKALAELKIENPAVNAIWSPARELPFREKYFDLVFTTGVLIHQTPQVLPIVMSEIVRCSRRYILCAEYFAEELEEVSYRNQNGALFKQNYGRLYQDLFPDLRLLEEGFLAREDGGWDDVTYWVFEKQS